MGAHLRFHRDIQQVNGLPRASKPTQNETHADTDLTLSSNPALNLTLTARVCASLSRPALCNSVWMSNPSTCDVCEGRGEAEAELTGKEGWALRAWLRFKKQEGG